MTPYTLTRHPPSTDLCLILDPVDRRGASLADGIGGRRVQSLPDQFFLTPARANKFATLYADGWWYSLGAFRFTETGADGFLLPQALAICRGRPLAREAAC